MASEPSRFNLNPDPNFFFGSKGHKRAMAYLEYGLSQGEGFIVITGEVGAGKTTLVRNLFRKLESEKIVAAQIVNTNLDSDDTLRMVAAAFGLPVTQGNLGQGFSADRTRTILSSMRSARETRASGGG